MPAPLITDLLRRRVRQDPGSPLVTWYGAGVGERTELSGVTFANWVDKTSNLLVDELMVEPGDEVALPLASSHPGHWVTLVWAMACWQTGAVVTVDSPDEAKVMVCGPDFDAVTTDGADLVACALHPLGLGFTTPLPTGIIDYALEVRGQPDAYAAVPQPGVAPAWVDVDHWLTQAELVAGPLDPGRVLVPESEPWSTVRAALVRPLVAGGSTVLVPADLDPLRRARIVADERVTAP